MTAEGPRTADAEAPPDYVVDARAIVEPRLGRYQLVMPLAQGGMGLVFAGRLVGAHGVERLVAIKTLRPITSANDRAALLREARLTARLHHRNIVATIDLGEVDDVPYVVMELVDGVPFSRLLGALAARRERLAPELAAWIVMQAAHGLHAAHELADTEGRALGLVHRDVSPQNILLSMSGDVKIADFGIAKFAGREESTATGMIKGKFAYMSPEQASAAELDRRSDLFALGIVLWEALLGERLFATDTPARTILRVVEHQPTAPVALRPEVGDALSSIAMRCLEKDRSDRFATAAELADALRSTLRARKAAIDEADLAATLQEHFGDERRQTMARLETASRASHPIAVETTETLPLPPLDASAAAVSLSTPRPTREPVPARPSRSWRTALISVLAMSAAGAAIVGTQPAGTDATAVIPSTTSAAVTSAPATSVPAAPSATPEPPPATTPSAVAVLAPPHASASAPVPSRARPRPSVRGSTSTAPVKAAASASLPAPPPPPKPAAGQPFESL